MKTPDIARLHDYRLMLVGARLMAKFVLENHCTSLKDWKHCRKVLECATANRECLATLLFSPEIRYEWSNKTSNNGKYEPFVTDIKSYDTNMIDLIPEWEWIVGGCYLSGRK